MPIDLPEYTVSNIMDMLDEGAFETCVELVLSDMPDATRDEAVTIVQEIEADMKGRSTHGYTHDLEAMMELPPDVETQIWQRVRYFTRHLFDTCACTDEPLHVPCSACREIFQELATWYRRGASKW